MTELSFDPTSQYDDEDFCWLCTCGNYQEDGFHCDVCGNEPPWGCDCSMCNDSDEDDDEYYSYDQY